MKLLTMMIGLLLVSNSFAASNLHAITCANMDGKMTLTPLAPEEMEQYDGLKKNSAVYHIQLDETLSSRYIGAIDPDQDRVVSFDARESAKAAKDILSDWDGNSGVNVTLPQGLLKNQEQFIGRDFQALVQVIYDDIAEDDVRNTLSCSIVP